MRKNTVRIVNAAGQTLMRETLKRALRMERRGLYRRRGNAFELIASDHRIEPDGLLQRRMRDSGYDLSVSRGLMLGADQMRHIPVIQPEKMLIRRSRRQVAA